MNTEQQFRSVMAECRSLFEKKLHDYGASWRILRPSSLTDQLFIKAKRIRSLEVKKVTKVGEGIRPEFMALINYGIVGLVQLERGYVDEVDMTPEEAMAAYDQHAGEALELMLKKNHDYDEAWRGMRVSSYTDFTDAGQRGHRRKLYGHHQLCCFRLHQAERRRRYLRCGT